MSDALIDRLTDNERQCLERVLDHQTAKEMARDLGISHHAVEKRLKRAREKLGAATSLEAARIYGARYGRPVSGQSDLAAAPIETIDDPQKTGVPARSRRRNIIMILATLVAGVTAILATGVTADRSEIDTVNGKSAAELSDPVHDRNRYRIEIGPISGLDPYDLAFEVIDSDRSDSISQQEFLDGARTFDNPGYLASGGDENNSLEAIFHSLDIDGSGLIERDEYRDISFTDDQNELYVFEIVFPGKTASAQSAGNGRANPPTKNGYSYAVGIVPRDGLTALETAFRMIDKDRSGTISVQEFIVQNPVVDLSTSQSAPDSDPIFAFMDGNSDGLIEPNEWSNVSFVDEKGDEYSFEISDSSTR
ncbi:EF-hand domain-containing protein [Sphingomicrobium flavum]|uniref:EF-hand domain-containing protein n=1 Tax=Sphingomicrobium flavum TaxID=1229164 RepID=UPI0021AD62ED|nr:EF-hand domain-containing protein [Sphingomicrobium flavum]